MNDDLISRQAAIDALNAYEDVVDTASQVFTICGCKKAITNLQPAQPDITDEQAIGHLQASGWMQSHDKQMYEMGLKERLADDSDSYDALLPSSQPEIIRCKDCKYQDENWRRVSVRWLPCMDVRTGSNWYCGSAERGKQNE